MNTCGIAVHAGIFTGTGQVGIPGQYPRPVRSGSPKFLLLICVKGSHITIYISLGNLRRAAFEKFDGIEERDKKAKTDHRIVWGKDALHVLHVWPV
jgi:hypothetical protein